MTIETTLNLGMLDDCGVQRTGTVRLRIQRKDPHDEQRDIDLQPVKDQFFTVSMTGNLGNAMGGQCLDSLSVLVTEPALRVRLLEIVALWKAYHLNDMQAGTRAQAQALRDHLHSLSDSARKEFNCDHYGNSCAHLESIGLNPDNGYRYGNAWLLRYVPDSVRVRLQELFGAR